MHLNYDLIRMGKYHKLIIKILSGGSDRSISFSELCNLLRILDFEERTKGSHHLFRNHSVREKINLQKDGNQAKPYQVKQVRNIIIKYNLGGKFDEQV